MSIDSPVAVIGSNGLLGSQFREILSGTNAQFVAFDRGNLNLQESADRLAKSLEGMGRVINCVGFTRVDEAEANQELCYFANAEVPKKLARACSLTGAKLAHFSTDYVFDGSKPAPYSVTDITNPTSTYGASKALGEAHLLESRAELTIYRTSWLYGRTGRSFPTAIASRLSTYGTVDVVNDQIGQPTWARDVVLQVLSHSGLDSEPKIVHAVASGKTSWAEFAIEIANSLGYLGRDVVNEVPTSFFPTLAKRPAWSVLDNSSQLVEPIGDWRERWRVAAPEVLREFL